jgi:DNA-binding transcriptional LysR family regulator
MEGVLTKAPRNIDVALLRTFIAVAELGQISKAAQRVNVTQSAASQQIARLETMLGVALLERGPNRIRLSADGDLLYGKAIHMLALNDEMLLEMDKSGSAVEIRLGVPHDLVEHFIPPILKRFGKSCPKVRVTLVSLSTSELIKLMEVGHIDLTLTTELSGSGEGDVLLLDQLVWVGAKNGRAFSTEPLVVSLGEDGDKFRTPTIAALNGAGIVYRSINQIGSLGSVLAMLAADMAVAPFLSSTVPGFLGVINSARLPELPEFEIKLVRAMDAIPPEHNTLARHIREYFREFQS